nr:zinc finger protein 852-like isoform X4 [Anser cygnoides]
MSRSMKRVFFAGYTGNCILTESEGESDILEDPEQDVPLQLPETHSPGWVTARLQQHQRAACNKPARQARDSRKLTLIANKQMLHTDEKPYKCTECGKGFKGTTTLLNHMRVHTGEKTFECLECGKRFNRKAGLVVHRRIHTGEKPYKCEECEKSFGCSSNLIAHRKIHAKKKAFSCDTHSQSGSTVLSQHQRAHMDEKPCGCAECGNSICPYSGFIKRQEIHVTETSIENTAGAYCSELTSQHHKEQQRSGTEKLDMDQPNLIFEELKKMRENMDMLLLNQQSQLQVLQQIQKQLNILLPGNDLINSNVYSLGLLLGRQAAAMASLSFPLLNPSSLLPESTHCSSQSSAPEILPSS